MENELKIELLKIAAHIAENVAKGDMSTIKDLGLAGHPTDVPRLALIEAIYSRLLATLSR
jgi:hypothetical protein